MPRGFCKFFCHASAKQLFSGVINEFEHRGMRLRHPANNHLIIWDSDGGEHELETSNDLLDLACRGSLVEFWSCDFANRGVMIESKEHFNAAYFYLDGHDEPQLRMVLDAAVSLFNNNDMNSIGFISDRRSITEEFDWDGFFVGNSSVVDFDGYLGYSMRKSTRLAIADLLGWGGLLSRNIYVVKRDSSTSKFVEACVFGSILADELK